MTVLKFGPVDGADSDIRPYHGCTCAGIAVNFSALILSPISAWPISSNRGLRVLTMDSVSIEQDNITPVIIH